uniref:Envelope glycoprotein n=1 Tax=Strongyloides stercoralis TaxID=6248 RepID=A0A0K0E4S9_STRER
MNSNQPLVGTLICVIILIITIAVQNQKLFWTPPLPMNIPLSIEIPENDIPYECPRTIGDGEISTLLKPINTCNALPNIVKNSLNFYSPQKSLNLWNSAENFTY